MSTRNTILLLVVSLLLYSVVNVVFPPRLSIILPLAVFANKHCKEHGGIKPRTKIISIDTAQCADDTYIWKNKM